MSSPGAHTPKRPHASFGPSPSPMHSDRSIRLRRFPPREDSPAVLSVFFRLGRGHPPQPPPRTGRSPRRALLKMLGGGPPPPTPTPAVDEHRRSFLSKEG